ncbi:NmrA family NAD(P)-binding protein [Nocardioides sp. KIGAM211]|uniref:NmrA family NAD(P)-binding protein n=1 Tax=Nocardioides luti TaxID=2761101 RepID=A0A7X0VBT0_9ACTN|nr:NAD(P)H-binding protein [Nocardioides luti]MBB6629084.1 NmrA family NAD(P)-binding protein [Nocardioides luti]
MSATRTVGIVGGHGKTGRAVAAALAERGAGVVVTGRAEWDDLAEALAGREAAYVVTPNLHDDEPGYVQHALDAAGAAGVGRVVYHSVASPHVPAMPHHLDKAEAEDLVRTSGLAWTILQPGAYLQNLDLTRTVRLPYRADAPFGFLDLADLGAAAATVLLDDGHTGATYELASRQATVADLAAEAGVEVVVERPTGLPVDREDAVLRAMFAHYDDHGLLAGTRVLDALLGR